MAGARSDDALSTSRWLLHAEKQLLKARCLHCLYHVSASLANYQGHF